MAPAPSSKHAYPSSNNYSQPQGGGKQQACFNPRKIFVGGLPPETAARHLRSLFQAYGTITDSVVLFHADGRPRGFGYVTFAQAQSAAKALDDKSNHLILMQEVDAKRAVPGTNKLFLGGLHQLVGDEDLFIYFAQFGEVADAYVMPDSETGRSRGFGFVSYMPGPEGAQAMAKAMTKRWHRLRNKKFEVKKAKTPGEMANEKCQEDKDADQTAAISPSLPKYLPASRLETETSKTSNSSNVASSSTVAPPLPLHSKMGLEKKNNISAQVKTQKVPGPLLTPTLLTTNSFSLASPTTIEGLQSTQSFEEQLTSYLLAFSKKTAPSTPAEQEADPACMSLPNAITTPRSSPKMVKPSLQKSPGTSSTMPSFCDSPKRVVLTPLTSSPVSFGGMFGGDGGDVADATRVAERDSLPLPKSTTSKSIAHRGPPPGIFFTPGARVTPTASLPKPATAPKQGPMLLGFEKFGMAKKAK